MPMTDVPVYGQTNIIFASSKILTLRNKHPLGQRYDIPQAILRRFLGTIRFWIFLNTFAIVKLPYCLPFSHMFPLRNPKGYPVL